MGERRGLAGRGGGPRAGRRVGHEAERGAGLAWLGPSGKEEPREREKGRREFILYHIAEFNNLSSILSFSIIADNFISFL